MRQFVVGAAKAGIDCLAIDLFGDWDTKKSCETISISSFDELPELLSRLPRSNFVFSGGLENHFKTLLAAAESHELVGPSPIDIRRAKDAIQLQSVCHAAEILFPQTTLTVPRNANDKWLAKPLCSAGGHSIEVLDRQKNYSENCFQAFAVGQSYSAVFRSSANGKEPRRTRLIGVTEQLIGEQDFCSRPFAYCGSIGPVEMPSMIQAELIRIGETIANEYSLNGIFGIDFVCDQMPVLIEVNPRLTASCELFELAGCFKGPTRTIVQQHITAFEPDENLEQDLSSEFVWGKAIVFSKWANEIFVDKKTQRQILQLNSSNGLKRVADIPNVEARIKPGGPIATVYCRDVSAKKVRNRLTDCAQVLRSCFQE